MRYLSNALQIIHRDASWVRYPPVVSLEESEKLANGTSPDDGYLRWQALATVQQADQERCAAVRGAQRCFLSSVEWVWDAKVQRIDKDTAASGKLVPQRDVMTGKILQGEWRLEHNLTARWADVIEAVKAAWEATIHPWERGEGEDSEEFSEEEIETGKEEAPAVVDSELNETHADESAESDTTDEDDGEDDDDDEGWTEHVHPGTGRSYYVNSATQETSWIKPPELEQQEQRSAVVTELQQEQRCSTLVDPPTAKTSTTTANRTAGNSRATGSASGATGSSKGPPSSSSRAAAKQRRAKRVSRIQARQAAASGGPGSAGSDAGSSGASKSRNRNSDRGRTDGNADVYAAAEAPKAAASAAQGQAPRSVRTRSTAKAKSRAARIAAKKHAAKSASA